MKNLSFLVVFLMITSCGTDGEADQSVWDKPMSMPTPTTTMASKANCTVYMGNTQKQDKEQQEKLFDQIAKAQGCAIKDIFHVGNMSYGANNLEAFLNDFSPVLAKNPQARFWPTRGNEDRMWPESLSILKSWFPYVTMQTCNSYYVKNGTLTTIVLDNSDGCPHDQQLRMVAEQLNDDPVAIVMHGASFTNYANVSVDDGIKKKLHTIVRGWNAIVFNGGAKGYERNKVHDINYVNPGSGGVYPDRCDDPKDFTVKCKPAYSFVICTDKMKCSAVDSDGKVFDSF